MSKRKYDENDVAVLEGLEPVKLRPEKWQSIPGYEDSYEVSSYGRVRSLDRVVGSKKCGQLSCKGRILSQLVNSCPIPYFKVVLYKNTPTTSKREVKQLYVHRLVLLAFRGPCPTGQEARHLDGNPQNNNLDNLVYSTRKVNAMDRARHGTSGKGSKNPSSKLTELMVVEARSLFRTTACTKQSLADKYGVRLSTICEALSGATWGHVPSPID